MKNEATLYFNKLDDKAIIPNGRREDAGLDFHVRFPFNDMRFKLLYPGESILMDTGIRSAFDNEHYLQITNKSSVGSKGLLTTAGVIDSGYRGEIKIPFFNISDNVILLIDKSKFTEEEDMDVLMLDLRDCYGDKLVVFDIGSKAMAQGILYPIPQVNVIEVTEDEILGMKSERADGGFGSTDNL